MNTFWKLVAVVLFVNAAYGQEVGHLLDEFVTAECKTSQELQTGINTCEKCLLVISEEKKSTAYEFMKPLCEKREDTDKCLVSLKDTIKKCMKPDYNETSTIFDDLSKNLLGYACKLTEKQMNDGWAEFKSCLIDTDEAFRGCNPDNSTAKSLECICNYANDGEKCLIKPISEENSFTKTVTKAGDYIRKNFISTSKFECKSGSSQLSHISLLGILMTAVLAALAKFFQLN